MILYILMACITLPYGEQHLAYPVDYCALSAACAHDARPVCASRGACARRTFLDTCDMYEFNCDYGTHFIMQVRGPCDIQPPCMSCC